MYCAALSCELSTNVLKNNSTEKVLAIHPQRRTHEFSPGMYGGYDGEVDIFLPKDYECILYIPQPALYLGSDAPMEPTLIWDGTPCGDGKVHSIKQAEISLQKLFTGISQRFTNIISEKFVSTQDVRESGVCCNIKSQLFRKMHKEMSCRIRTLLFLYLD